MSTLAEIKKMLTESLGDEQTTKIVESLEKYKTKLEADNQKLIDEGIKEKTVKLEADYLEKLEEAKAEADKSLKKELTVFEKQLAARCKTVLEQAIDTHGDRLAKIEESASAKRGSVLLQEVEALVNKARSEINEKITVKPEDMKKLQDENKQLKEDLATAKKQIIEQKARANVAESELKNIRENLETTIQVTVNETENTKGKPANEEHKDSKNEDPINENTKTGKPALSPEMVRMRKLAGIK